MLKSIMSRLFSIFPLLITALVTLGLAQPLEKRAEQFNIYAFGDNISGLQVYYSEGWCKNILLSENLFP